MEHYCNICKKEYKSYQTLWKHNKKFHNDKVIPNVIHNRPKCNPKVSNCNPINGFGCRYCDKIYSNRQNRWKHEQKCKINHEKILALKKENQNKLLELQLKKEEL